MHLDKYNLANRSVLEEFRKYPNTLLKTRGGKTRLILDSPIRPRGKASTVGHPQVAVHHALAFGQSRVVPHLGHHVVYGLVEVHLVLSGSGCVVSGQYGVEGNLERSGVALRLRVLLALHFTPPRFAFFARGGRDQNMRQHQHHKQLFAWEREDRIKYQLNTVLEE